MLGVPANSRVTSSSFYHRPNGLSVSDVDLDIEGAGGGRIDEVYDAGLPWPLGSSARPTSWSAKGPAEHIPRLPLLKSLQCHLIWARAGWWDGNRWQDTFKLIASSSEIRNGVLKGLLLSGTISAVVFFFELAFFPKVLFQQTPVQNVQGMTESGSVVGGLGNVFWMYPLIGGSYMLASSWTSDIAQAAYKLRHGHVRRLTLSNPSLPPGTSRRLLQESYRMILIVNYTVFYLLLGRIPYLGRPLSFLFMCMVDGYYCFEQAWISRGWSLERRMRYCEERWSYFVAFGLPSTAISFFHPSGLLNLMLFMLVFPFCTVLAMLADPQPRISTSGALAASSNGFGSVGGGSDYANGPLHRLVPSRLAVFWPTVKLHRIVLQLLPSLADAPLAPSAQSFERNANMYGRAGDSLGTSGFSVNGGFGGFGTGGKRAAEMVGGIFNNGSRSNLNSGRNSPSPYPAYGGVPRSSHETMSGGDMNPQMHLGGGAASGTYSTAGQNMYSRASAAPSRAPLGPPPKGPASNHRKAD